MFKLVVLSAFLAVATAAPGFFHGGLVATHSAVVAAPAIVKTAPVITAYAAPVVAHPIVKAAPVLAAVPAAVSHQSRTDIISKPVVAAYAAHVPAVATYSAPLAYSHAW